MIKLARAAHVPGVVWWIGGVAMVTATLWPVLVRGSLAGPERLRLFREIRGRFVGAGDYGPFSGTSPAALHRQPDPDQRATGSAAAHCGDDGQDFP